MPNLNVVRTREDTIALMLAYLGTRWPNPWWPTGNPVYDDCAACVSWALFGLNGNQPYQTFVSGVIERSGLTKYPGSYGMQRGDAVGFLWGGDNNYDHIELALESPDSAGNFRTIGTNAAPSDAMAIRWRNTRYVVAYGRPAYLAPAGGGGKPTPETLIEEQEMALRDGGYIVETNSKNEITRGAIWGPGVPGGVIVDDANPIEALQAMGNLAGVRSFNPSTGAPQKIGAPIKYVKTPEFNATVELAKRIDWS